MSTNDDDGIYRVETVPPPNGESDAYNAPTRVGQMAGAIVEELVAQAQREAEQTGEAAPSQVGKKETIDPAALLNVDSLTAQLDAAARAPSDAPAKKGDSTPPVISLGSVLPAAVVKAAPSDPPVVASGEPATAAGPSAAATATSSSRASTLMLLFLVLTLAGLGLYLLRR
jgi:predicted component of type VI protein secretion system